MQVLEVHVVGQIPTSSLVLAKGSFTLVRQTQYVGTF